MIMEFVNRFMENKAALKDRLSQKHPENYKELVEEVIKAIADDGGISPNKITEIKTGGNRGTNLYVILSDDSFSGDMWYVKVAYGSCSGCDTLESIRDYSDDKPSDSQVADYMTLALHIIQALKKFDDIPIVWGIDA